MIRHTWRRLPRLAVVAGLMLAACRAEPRPTALPASLSPTDADIAPRSTNTPDIATPTSHVTSPPPTLGVFIDCMDVTPGLPSCSGKPPLASGWIAFLAQNGPDSPPSQPHLARLDGDGQWWSSKGDEISAIPFPEGTAQPLSTLKPSSREEDWILSPDGRLATLRLLRGPPERQILALREHVDATSEITRGLTLDSGEPDLDPNQFLLDWPAGSKQVLAIAGIHVMANSNWISPEMVTIDTDTGVERHLGVNLPEHTQAAGLSTAASATYDLHPTQPNLLAATDSDLTWSAGENLGTDHLALVDISTGQVRHLTDDSLFATGPVWSPDGASIAFSALSPPPELPFGWPNMVEDPRPLRRGLALYVVDVATGHVRRLTSPDAGWDTRPTWSADGSRLLYMRGIDPDDPEAPPRYQVRVVRADGERDDVLLDHVGPDWAYWPGPTPSP
jgi:hypothetical protein